MGTETKPAAHTPGPWRVVPQAKADGRLEIEDADNGVLAQAYGDDGDPQCWPVTANARLIAAAPELLAACLTALRSMKHEEHRAAVEVLKAAIAKAEGR